MNHKEFELELEQSFLRSKKVLAKKAKEYSDEDGDRLEQFHRVAAANNVEPTEALIGMAVKHWTSLADMCKCPDLYKLKNFREKITDLRNYTLLLDALLVDMEIE